MFAAQKSSDCSGRIELEESNAKQLMAAANRLGVPSPIQELNGRPPDMEHSWLREIAKALNDEPAYVATRHAGGMWVFVLGVPGVRELQLRADDAKGALARWREMPPSKPFEIFRRALINLVDTWLRAGRNFAKWADQNPKAQTTLQTIVRLTPHTVMPVVDGSAHIGRGDTSKPLTYSVHDRLYAGGEGTDAAFFQAYWMFLDLAQSKERDRFGKCRRCGRYFVGRRGRSFCSDTCRKGTAAAKSMAVKRAEERRAKLRKVRSALSNRQRLGWDRKDHPDIKRWVAKQTNVSMNWITRAERKREIRIPKHLHGSQITTEARR